MKLQKYIKAVRTRLENPKVKRMIQFAKCNPSYTGALIDDKGFEVTADAILTSAANMFNATQGRDAIAEMVTNFSAGMSDGIGYSDVTNVNTVGAIDVTLLARAESLIPYVCIDRAMPTPDATVYFQNLVALNDNGEVKAGEVINGSYIVPNMKVDLDLEKKSGTESEVDNAADSIAAFGAPIVPGKVVITYTEGTGSAAQTFIGKDFDGKGTVYFSGTDLTASVDYKTGEVTVGGSVAGKATIEVMLDSNKSEIGQGILRVGPQYTNVQLHSIPQNIILENNMMSQAYMNKTYTLATGSSTSPYNDTLFERVKNTYVEYLNKKILVPMVACTRKADSTLDLSSYALSDFAYTKNDMISQAITNMSAALLSRAGVGMTTIVTNSYGAALLMNIPNLFVATPDAQKGINGLIGYWQGIPVYRHNYLDIAYGTVNTAQFIGCFKAADNSAGSQVYGEFLPFTSTGLVSNFMNPTQIANGYFSMVANEVVQPNLFTRTEILVPKLQQNPGSGSGAFGTNNWLY